MFFFKCHFYLLAVVAKLLSKNAYCSDVFIPTLNARVHLYLVCVYLYRYCT